MSKQAKQQRNPGNAINALSAELAWIRSAGFTSAARAERLLVRFARMAQENPAAVVLASIQSGANAIQEESRHVEIAELATRARRRAV